MNTRFVYVSPCISLHDFLSLCLVSSRLVSPFLTSTHLVSTHLTSSFLTLFQISSLTLPQLDSPCLTSPHLSSSHLVHLIPPRLTSPHDATAAYLVDDCQLVSHAGRRRLRSADIDTCCVPRTNTRFGGDRSFAAAGPRLWNSLPARIRQPDNDTGEFRRQLKSFLFK